MLKTDQSSCILILYFPNITSQNYVDSNIECIKFTAKSCEMRILRSRSGMTLKIPKRKVSRFVSKYMV